MTQTANSRGSKISSVSEGVSYLRRALERGQMITVPDGSLAGDYVYAMKGHIIDQPDNELWFEALQSGIYSRCEMYSGGVKKGDRWLHVMDSDAFMDTVIAPLYEKMDPTQWQMMVMGPGMDWALAEEHAQRYKTDNPNQIVWSKAEMERRHGVALGPGQDAPRPSPARR